MTNRERKPARSCKPRLRTERRKSGSMRTGKDVAAKTIPRGTPDAQPPADRPGRGLESIVPEAKTMTDEEAADLLRLALTGEEARHI